MSRRSSPVLACWIIESVLPVAHREAMLGDLVEEYVLRVKTTSSWSASCWFWSQTFRSLPSIAWSSMRNGNWLISMGGTSVYILIGLLKFAADRMIAKWIAPQQMTYIILAPCVFLALTAAGGCLAARIRRSAKIFLALFVLITVIVLIERSVCAVPVPWWYQFGFLTLGPLSVLITPAIFWQHKESGEDPAT